jgi:hypothetical protein
MISTSTVSKKFGQFCVFNFNEFVMKPLGKPGHSWVDNIRMVPGEVGCGCVDWIGLAQDRDRWRWRALGNSMMNFRVP